MSVPDLKTLQDFEVSTEAMSLALTQHNQPELLRALSLLNPENVTRRCIYVADAAQRLKIPDALVDAIFDTAATIDKTL